MTSMPVYDAHADRFTAVVEAAGDTDWSSPSPCEGWTAADVLDHVVDTQRDFLDKRGADVGARPEGTPQEVWAAHRDVVRRVTADDAFVSEEYDGYFGRTTVADTLANFYGFDLLVHRWDLARGLGRDTSYSDAELDLVEATLPGFGEHLYDDGVCAPAVPVPDDAPRQVRLLAVMGRSAG
jgi:uncharacterized protein (TIGR03086 family)